SADLTARAAVEALASDLAGFLGGDDIQVASAGVAACGAALGAAFGAAALGGGGGALGAGGAADGGATGGGAEAGSLGAPGTAWGAGIKTAILLSRRSFSSR